VKGGAVLAKPASLARNAATLVAVRRVEVREQKFRAAVSATPEFLAEPAAHVLNIQRFANEIGVALKVDGQLGPFTIRFTETFQRMMLLGPYRHAPLKVDGRPGPKTTEAVAYARANGYRCIEHFQFAAFASKNPDRVVTTMNPRLLATREIVILAEDIRMFLGVPVVIYSAFRDRVWNTRVGGAGASEHLWGAAIDIDPALGLTPAKAKQLGAIGVGVVRASGKVLHVDKGHRAVPAQWFYA
jgi:Peptidase M15